MTALPDDVLATIPGWEGATCTELTGGLTNKSWRVVQGERAGVLKVDKSPRQLPFNTRYDEASVQKAAAKAGLAPNVILANDGFYLTEFVEGSVWERACLEEEGNLARLATALKRMHSLPLTGRSFDATIAAKRYVEKITVLDSHIIERCTAIISNMRLPHNLCCCHNDIVVQNIITTPALMFLDWEYACDNDPFFDLATVVEHHELSESQAAVLLDTYFDGDGLRWRRSMEKYRMLYLALLCLWMASQPEIDGAELDKVVERLATSCF
ncbi:MAG: phosphotransferase [Gammaproteobacteria bacterium]|jgi:thiamine kinase-like enzyme|nr:phosphotransferase [Gammaproteobacteria bacterium]